MKLINEKAKPYMASAPDKSFRAQIRNPYLDLSDRENPVLISTDNKIMAANRIELDESDTEGYVSVEALKADKTNKGISVNGDEKIGTMTLRRPTVDELGQFPPAKKLLEETKKKNYNATFTIDVKLLRNLSQALGDDYLTLRMTVEGETVKSAMLVEANNGKCGMIMPRIGGNH